MGEAVFHTTDEVIEDVEKVAADVADAPVVVHNLPPVEEVASDVVEDAKDVATVASNGSNVLADVAPVEDAVKTTDDLIREIHADIASVKVLLESIGQEVKNGGLLSLFKGLF